MTGPQDAQTTWSLGAGHPVPAEHLKPAALGAQLGELGEMRTAGRREAGRLPGSKASCSGRPGANRKVRFRRKGLGHGAGDGEVGGQAGT